MNAISAVFAPFNFPFKFRNLDNVNYKAFQVQFAAEEKTVLAKHLVFHTNLLQARSESY